MRRLTLDLPDRLYGETTEELLGWAGPLLREYFDCESLTIVDVPHVPKTFSLEGSDHAPAPQTAPEDTRCWKQCPQCLDYRTPDAPTPRNSQAGGSPPAR